MRTKPGTINSCNCCTAWYPLYCLLCWCAQKQTLNHTNIHTSAPLCTTARFHVRKPIVVWFDRIKAEPLQLYWKKWLAYDWLAWISPIHAHGLVLVVRCACIALCREMVYIVGYTNRLKFVYMYTSQVPSETTILFVYKMIHKHKLEILSKKKKCSLLEGEGKREKNVKECVQTKETRKLKWKSIFRKINYC